MEKTYTTKSYKSRCPRLRSGHRGSTTTRSSGQTQKLGEDFALRLRSGQAKEIENRKSAVVLGLSGNLGGGKTTFLQGFARGLGIKEKILSPTFVIMKRFHVGALLGSLKFHDFYHIDCYRLKTEKDILELDFKKIISNPKNIVAVEWSERIKKALPDNSIVLSFRFIDKNKREIKFKM